jgi:NADH:ubiquinone oxidoreductase subunit F (NADH-binding)
VVINGSEGEPASAKDRVLLTRVPHLVLDGALAAAAATGAADVILCLDRHDHAAIGAVEGALADRARAGEPTEGMRIATMPNRFVAGEESALVNLLNGGDAKPTAKPPRVFERGVDGRPTLVINVETAAHLAQIVQWGPAWFRTCGTVDEPGTMLATISGAVRHPGVVELALGTSVVDAVRAAGGSTRPPTAILLGGYYGSWLSATDAGTAVLTNASLRPLDAALGCGSIVVVPEDCCGLAETARLLAWMSAQSAGQCGPCVHGLAALAEAMHQLAAGRPRPDTPAQLRRWADMIDGRGACSLPDGAARLVRSTLRAFDADIEHHLCHGPCWRTANRPLLPTPPATDNWR